MHISKTSLLNGCAIPDLGSETIFIPIPFENNIKTFLNDYNTFTFTFHYSALQKHLHHRPSVSDSHISGVTVYYRIQ